MSIASEITRLQSNVAFAYDVCEAKGATMPTVQDQNSAHLASTINSIPEGIPVDEDSLTPIEFGINESGFYITDVVGGGTPVAFGRDATGVYVVKEDDNDES